MDYISREDAINAAIDAADDWDGGYIRSRAEMIEKKIKALPAADVEERKVGKWIRKDKGGVFGSPIYKCSCCGQGDFGNLFIYGASYCPICGAKMEG